MHRLKPRSKRVVHILWLLHAVYRCGRFRGRRLWRGESTELSSIIDAGSRSEGSFLPRLRPVRVPTTREDLRHDCSYSLLLRSRMHDHTSVSQYRPQCGHFSAY